MSFKQISGLLAYIILFASCQQSNEELVDKAINYSKQGKYDKAIEIYTEVIKRNNKLQVTYYNRGLDYLTTKQYGKALEDFNQVMALQSHDGVIITYNPNSPFASEVVRAQVPYNDALYQRAQVKYFMDSLKSSFNDFQTLVNDNYEKSNCLLWQGTLYIKAGQPEKACDYFAKAKQFAFTTDDKTEANEMIKTYCAQANPAR